MKILFIDTETTGLDPVRNSVIQIGMVVCALEGGRFVEKAGYEYTLPSDGHVWDMDAAKVNGWPGRYVGKSQTSPAYAVNMLINEARGAMLGGHNVGFDIAFLDSFCDRFSVQGRLSAVASHRKVDSQSLAFPLVALGLAKSTGLAEMAKLFPELFDDPAAQHSALADARASMRLANRMIVALQVALGHGDKAAAE